MAHPIARITVVVAALAVTTLGPLGAQAHAAPSAGDRSSMQLTINGGRPVSKSHDGHLLAYATCPDGRAPGALEAGQLGMPGDWYSTSPYGGYWAKLAVIDAAKPGRHTATVDCRRAGTPATEFTIVE